MKKITVHQPAMLAFGIFMNASGVAFITKASWGISPVSCVAFSLSNIQPALSFGEWSYVFQFCLIAALCILLKTFRRQYLLSFLVSVVFGYTLDVVRLGVNLLPCTVLCRIAYAIIGQLCLIIGVSHALASGLTVMPQDMFVKEIANYFHKNYGVLKTGFDIFCVLTGSLLGWVFCRQIYGLGLLTVVGALVTGKGIYFARAFIERHYCILSCKK